MRILKLIYEAFIAPICILALLGVITWVLSEILQWAYQQHPAIMYSMFFILSVVWIALVVLGLLGAAMQFIDTIGKYIEQ
jgi:small-conductance mechanosensitive channel